MKWNGRDIPLRTMFVVIVLTLSVGTNIVLMSWNTELKKRAGNLASALHTTRSDLDVCEVDQVRVRSNLILDRELVETVRELRRSENHLHKCGSLGSRRPSAERGETYFGHSWSSKGANVVRLKQVNSHRQNRTPTQELVGASHRNNGRAIPWWSIFVAILLWVGTLLVLRWELQALDAEQLRLRASLTARDLELAETRQREQRQTELLCASENKRAELHVILDRALSRVDEATNRERAEGEAGDEDRRHQQLNGNYNREQGVSADKEKEKGWMGELWNSSLDTCTQAAMMAGITFVVVQARKRVFGM